MPKEITRPDFYKEQEAIIDLFQALCPMTVMSELYEVIGNSRIFFNVIRTFAGTKIKFPSLEHIQNILIAIDVILSVTVNPEKDLKDVVETLANDYGLLPADIFAIYDKGRRIVKRGRSQQQGVFSQAINNILVEKSKENKNERKAKLMLADEKRRRLYDVFADDIGDDI